MYTMRSRLSRGLLWTVAALCAVRGGSAQEQPERFDVGVRGVVLVGKGQPANDMIGEGLVGRFALNAGWRLGIALDAVAFDYETPNGVLGIPSASTVDGGNEWSRVSVFVDRQHDGNRAWDWFWRVGMGLASVEKVDNVSGVRADGGTFDIATTADDELHVFAGGGLRRPLAKRWTLDAAVTIEHHGTDYRITDTVSGVSGSIGSHTVYGISLGIGYRF